MVETSDRDGASLPFDRPEQLAAALGGLDVPIEWRGFEGGTASFAGSPFVACIPVRNEADRIERCLAALDAELGAEDGVVVVANNCDDRTVAVASAAMDDWTRPWLVVACGWKPRPGGAPLARRIALDTAHRLAPDAVLLSVDGDTVVLPGLRAAYTEEFAKGYDLVCGRIGFLPEEAAMLPAADPDNERIIREYREASRHVAALLHPDPDNPWPHHGNIGGANFAVRGPAYRAAGPLPTPASGEDRALRRRFEGFGMRIRYANGPRVETSCRLEGRAAGGLSDELRRNRTQADPIVDELLEPPESLVLRHRSRAAFLGLGETSDRASLLRALGLASADAERLARAAGPMAWQETEDLSPALKRTRLHLSDLRRFLPALLEALAAIRDARSDIPAHPGDPPAAALPRSRQ